jgi:hypothetical protein
MSEKVLLKIVETLAKAGARDLSAITAVSKGVHSVNINQMMGNGQRRTSEFTGGSFRPGSNPLKNLGSFLEASISMITEALEHIHDHFGPKVIEKRKHDELREGGGGQGTTSAETSAAASAEASVDDGKQAPASPVSGPEKQSEKQVDTQSSKPEVALSEDSAVVDPESEVVALRRQLAEANEKREAAYKKVVRDFYPRA